MEGGDRWNVKRWPGGAQDRTIINHIMFRFRPIAPKPVTGDSDSGESVLNTKSLDVGSKRKKRKYVRVCEKNNTRKKRILEDAAVKEDHLNHENKGFVTLQLMPEKADLKKSIIFERSWDVVDDEDDDNDNYRFQDPPSLFSKLVTAADHVAAMMGRMRVVESWVTAESVTESSINEGEMGKCTDEEKMENLEKDTCPGFVTDGLNRVMWVNQAYKTMVGLEEEEGAETTAGLVVNEGFSFPCGAFSCRVRLRYVDGKGKNYSKTVPCDVWKLSSGGFAWRLDVNAALSLGL